MGGVAGFRCSHRPAIQVGTKRRVKPVDRLGVEIPVSKVAWNRLTKLLNPTVRQMSMSCCVEK